MQVKASTQTTSGDAARTFAYTYNADGTLKTQTYPSGLVVAYDYDAAGRPKAVGKNTPGVAVCTQGEIGSDCKSIGYRRGCNYMFDRFY